MVRFFRYLIYIAGLLPLLACQIDLFSGVENGVGKGAALSFKVFAIGNTKPRGLKVETAPEQVETIEFQNYRRSASYEYNGKQPIVFFREIINDDNTVTRFPVATVNLPNSVNEYLLLFVPTGEEKEAAGEFNIFHLNESIQAFPLDSIIIFNGAKEQLIGRVGKKNTIFSNGFSKEFDIKDFYIAEEDFFLVPVKFALETNEGPQIVFTNNFEFHPGQRTILILNPPDRPGSHRLKVNKLTDSLTPFHILGE